MPIPNIGAPTAIIPVDAYGNTGAVSAFGSLSVSVDPLIVFIDTFDGATLDTVYRWTSAGTVPPTASGSGSALINPGSTASASTSLATQTTFQPSGLETYGAFVQLEASTIATGNHRFFGLGTQPASWTAATPLQDAFGFEIDTTGTLRASVYANGTRIDSTALRVPTDGIPHLLLVSFRPGVTYFYLDNTSQPLAVSFASPAVQNLPLRLHSINGGSTTVGTPTATLSSLALIDSSRPTTAVSDGQFPFRRAAVSSKSLNVAGASNYTTLTTAGTNTLAQGGGVYYGVNVLSAGTSWTASPFDVVVTGTTTTTATLAAISTATGPGIIGAPGAAGVGVRFNGNLVLVTAGTPGAFNALWD
jgi:hypothetical protein